MQWRAIGQLSGIPFGTLYTLFARWTRLGLWRRLLDRPRRTWRLACGDTAEPSTVVIDSRTCPSAPRCFARGVDRGVSADCLAPQRGGVSLTFGPAVLQVLEMRREDPTADQQANGDIRRSMAILHQPAGPGNTGQRHATEQDGVAAGPLRR